MLFGIVRRAVGAGSKRGTELSGGARRLTTGGSRRISQGRLRCFACSLFCLTDLIGLLSWLLWLCQPGWSRGGVLGGSVGGVGIPRRSTRREGDRRYGKRVGSKR